MAASGSVAPYIAPDFNPKQSLPSFGVQASVPKTQPQILAEANSQINALLQKEFAKIRENIDEMGRQMGQTLAQPFRGQS